MRETSLDLGAVCDVILSDLGATLQILRVVAGEFPDVAERPQRMEDCIASLEIDGWFHAVSSRPIGGGSRQGHIVATWNHCHTIASFCRMIAGALKEIDPEQAYLVGLLHELGSLPSALEWDLSEADLEDRAAVARVLALRWRLPWMATAGLRDATGDGEPSVWVRILTAAHEMESSALEAEDWSADRRSSFAEKLAWILGADTGSQTEESLFLAASL